MTMNMGLSITRFKAWKSRYTDFVFSLLRASRLTIGCFFFRPGFNIDISIQCKLAIVPKNHFEEICEFRYVTSDNLNPHLLLGIISDYGISA